MATGRFGSVNVIVSDVDALARFVRALGVDLDPAPPEWATHHRGHSQEAGGLEVDFDSPEFAGWWGGVSLDDMPGVVVNLHVDSRAAVDEIYREAVSLGAATSRAPYDAFWGARYAVVRAPGPCLIGLMSPVDPELRSAPPSTDGFATPPG